MIKPTTPDVYSRFSGADIIPENIIVSGTIVKVNGGALKPLCPNVESTRDLDDSYCSEWYCHPSIPPRHP